MLRTVGIVALSAAIACGQSVVELARKAPPEMFANAVITLVERGMISSAEQRRDVLEEAFQAAKHAREPVRLIAMPQLETGSRAGLREAAGALGLDALSLESRVVALLAPTDPAKARELFQSIEYPVLEARPCEDPMIADASAYYQTAGKLGADAPFLMSVIGPARSPGELENFAKLLAADSSMAQAEFRLLLGALALKMQTAAPNYRSFTMAAGDLSADLDRLVARAQKLDVPVDALAQGARKLATTQLSTPHCRDEFGGAKAFVDWFNQSSNRRFRGSLDPIAEEETYSKKDLGSATAEIYFSSGSGKQIEVAFQGLRMALGKPEWPDQLADFLRQFSAWKPEGAGSPAANIDMFHQKMTVLHGLFQLIPPGPDRDKLMARAIEFLRPGLSEAGDVEHQYPAEWLLQVRSFAGIMAGTEPAMGDRAKLLAAFTASEIRGWLCSPR